ncbi:MAG: non-canonical purine NTP pyrophosphatase, partial [Planctomycetales bacterium]|nr:non-canonical purine NTP pyrophosphatase [Planctomycetales bacterium]
MTKPVLILATRNKKKRGEMAALLAPYGVDVRSLDEYADAPHPEETGATFAENAAIKATEVARALGQWTLADDSGIEIDFLAGRPGVFSARYAGPDATDEDNNDKLLAELSGVPDQRRGAGYACHLALADPTGHIRARVEERCRGRILHERHGSGGFGYDPLFLVPEYHRTFGLLGPALKNA